MGGRGALPEAPGRGANRPLGLRGVLMVRGRGREWALVQGRPGSEPTISVPHPLHQPPKIRSVLLAVALVACQEFDPDDADLSGTWLLSDNTVFPPPEGPFNTCLMRNVRLDVDPGPPAGMFAQTREGPCNARSMVYGGSRYRMTPLITITFLVMDSGSSLCSQTIRTRSTRATSARMTVWVALFTRRVMAADWAVGGKSDTRCS